MASTQSTVPTEDAPKPLHELMRNGKFVKIYVGSKKKRWVVHLAVICDRSAWFKKAFTGGYLETQKKEIHLEDEDPRMFCHFVDWIYGKTLYCEMDHTNPGYTTFKHVKEWLALYIFAEKISLDELAREALVQYELCSEGTLPCNDEILIIYENTPDQSPLRQHVVKTLMAEFLHQGPDNFNVFADAITCNLEFARDISEALKDHTRLSNKECELPSCTAHLKILKAPRGQRKR